MLKKTLKKTFIVAALSQLIILPANALTEITPEEQSSVEIKKMPQARVFAEFTDKLPAVLNYFTPASEKEVIQFYENAYGEVLERNKRGSRLTLYFADKLHKIRVAITTQDKKRQVDILLTKKEPIAADI